MKTPSNNKVGRPPKCRQTTKILCSLLNGLISLQVSQQLSARLYRNLGPLLLKWKSRIYKADRIFAIHGVHGLMSVSPHNFLGILIFVFKQSSFVHVCLLAIKDNTIGNEDKTIIQARKDGKAWIHWRIRLQSRGLGLLL